MDEATKQAMNEFVVQTIAAARAGAAWTAEQAPLVVQEWLRWQMFEAVGLAVLGLLGVAVLLSLSAHCWRKKKANPREEWEFGGVMFAVFSLAPFLLFVTSFFDAAKVYIAPRVIVVEELAKWIR